MILNEIIFEKAESGKNKNFFNLKAKNLMLDQKLDELQGNDSKPILLIKQKSSGQ